MITIGMIGAGHMGSAILKAADRAALPLRFIVSDARPEAAETLASALVHEGKAAGNETVVREADLLFLAVKPQNMKDLLSSLSSVFAERKKNEAFRPLTVVTMAAGMTVGTILGFIGLEFPVIRIMPNTPIDVGCGAIAYTLSSVSQDALDLFKGLLQADALLVEVPEDKLDAVCALSGCGPAFVYLMIRGMADAGQKLGLAPEEALLLSAKTLEGAASMVLEDRGTPTELKNAVCSPGGATVEGVKVLEGEGFEALLGRALEASYKRTLELK